MRTLLLIIFFSFGGSCQNVEEGWKDLKPLHTSKKQVERHFGTPKVDNNGYHNYKSGDVAIQVNYSTAPCVGDILNRGVYKIPAETVLSYILHFHSLTELSKLKFNRKQYKESRSEHQSEQLLLGNKDAGILIVAYIWEGKEYISSIEFRPRPKDAEKLKCPK